MHVKDRGLVFDATTAPADSRSSAFTGLTRLGNGDLLVSFRTGTGRDSPDGRVRIMRGRDTGQIWETLHPGLTAVIEGIEGNLTEGFFTEIAPDHLLGAFAWVDRSNPELSFVNPATAGVLPMRALLAESLDGGETWGAFRDVDLRPQVGCAVTGPIRSLPNETLALPYESWKAYDDPSPGTHLACLRLSFDGGASWPDLVQVATDPAARVFYWDQRLAHHPETGRLVAMFWTHDRDAGVDIENHIAWGSADGRDWSVPVPTGWRGQHCQPLSLGGDRLAALYVHRHDPPSLRAVISEDFGETWSRDDELIFYTSSVGTESGTAGPREFEDFWQDMMAWRFGHPRGVLLPDGDLFVAFYGGDTAATSMHWVRIAQ